MTAVNLDQIVHGAMKFARLQAYRERMNRYGLKRSEQGIRDLFPEEVATTTTPDQETINRDEIARAVRLFEEYLQEFTPRLDYQSLLRRVILGEEPTATVARELQIRPETGRKLVSRFKSMFFYRNRL